MNLYSYISPAYRCLFDIFESNLRFFGIKLPANSIYIEARNTAEQHIPMRGDQRQNAISNRPLQGYFRHDTWGAKLLGSSRAAIILHIDSIQMAAKECFRFCHFLAKPVADCLIQWLLTKYRVVVVRLTGFHSNQLLVSVKIDGCLKEPIETVGGCHTARLHKH